MSSVLRPVGLFCTDNDFQCLHDSFIRKLIIWQTGKGWIHFSEAHRLGHWFHSFPCPNMDPFVFCALFLVLLLSSFITKKGSLSPCCKAKLERHSDQSIQAKFRLQHNHSLCTGTITQLLVQIRASGIEQNEVRKSPSFRHCSIRLVSENSEIQSE